MKYRRVGDTGLTISEIGFGTGGNAGLMVRGEAREQDGAIAYALDKGITYFDTSPDYGDGVAERNLGRALRAAGALNAIVTTKVEIRAENLDDIASHVVRSLDASLTRLGRDHVDVVQIHNGPVASPPALLGRGYKTLALEDFIKPGGALDGLERVVRAGKARHLGFICRGNDRAEVTRLLEIGRFKLVNLPYSLINPTAGRPGAKPLPQQPDFDDLINVAGTHGCGVAVYSPLAGGLLTPSVLDGGATHPLARSKDVGTMQAGGLWRRAQDVAAVSAAFGLDIVDLAYRFILDHPRVTTIAAGVSSRAHVDQLAGLVAGPARQAVPPDLMARLDALWRMRDPE